MEQDFIFGKNSVLGALKSYKSRINKIIISKNANSDVKIREIVDLARENKIAFQFVPKEKFQKYKEFNHQGIVAFVAPIEYQPLDILFENMSSIAFSETFFFVS